MAQGNQSGQQQQQGIGTGGQVVVGWLAVTATLMIVAALYTGFGGKSIKLLNLAS